MHACDVAWVPRRPTAVRRYMHAEAPQWPSWAHGQHHVARPHPPDGRPRASTSRPSPPHIATTPLVHAATVPMDSHARTASPALTAYLIARPVPLSHEHALRHHPTLLPLWRAPSPARSRCQPTPLPSPQGPLAPPTRVLPSSTPCSTLFRATATAPSRPRRRRSPQPSPVTPLPRINP
jgi:hypothetical protein